MAGLLGMFHKRMENRSGLIGLPKPTDKVLQYELVESLPPCGVLWLWF